jgi:hypothetical protein
VTNTVMVRVSVPEGYEFHDPELACRLPHCVYRSRIHHNIHYAHAAMPTKPRDRRAVTRFPAASPPYWSVPFSPNRASTLSRPHVRGVSRRSALGATTARSNVSAAWLRSMAAEPGLFSTPVVEPGRAGSHDPSSIGIPRIRSFTNPRPASELAGQHRRATVRFWSPAPAVPASACFGIRRSCRPER